MNDNLVLISGKTATGKSLSLMNLPQPEGVMYLNCENNKSLPFKSDFKQYLITDPMQVYEAFAHAESKPKIHTIIVDTLTFMMDMYETMYVLNPGNDNTMKSWGEYAQFFKKLMSQHVANSTKDVIFLGHTMDVLNEKTNDLETLVKVKGSLMNQGIESYFTNVISTKKVLLTDLEDYKSSMLNITKKEEMLGYKYCYQTDLTAETVHDRIRSPLAMWDEQETFIDNDINHVLKRLKQYYK